MMPKLREFLATQVQEMTKGLASQMPSLTEPQSFKDSQNKLLSKNLAPEPRVEFLMQLDWSVVTSDAEPLILGDVGVVAGSESGELMNILRHDPALDSIYLPLSSNRLLLGQRPGVSIASVRDLNVASAELSREFFISASPDAHRRLHSQIGTKQMLLPPDEVKDIVGSAFDGLKSGSGSNK